MSQEQDPGASGRVAPSAGEEEVRSASKWLLAAFAALFTFIAGGLQFGDVDLADISHPVLVAAAVAISMIASATVITLASSILVDLGLTFDDVIEREVNGKMRLAAAGTDQALAGVAANDSVLRSIEDHGAVMRCGVTSPAELRDLITKARTTDGTDSKLKDAEADLEVMLRAANRVHYSTRFRVLTRVVIGAMVAVLVAFALYLVAISPGSRAEPLDVAEPMAGQLYLNDGVLAKDLGFGEKCAETQFVGLLVGGSFGQPLFAASPAKECRPLQIEVTPELGVVIPVRK